MASPNPKADTTLHIQRRIAAPREKVFAAWLDPAALTKWFAPSDKMIVTVHELDARVGGRYRITMHDPGEQPHDGCEIEGRDHVVTGVYREIRAPERLVFTWAWEGGAPGETLVTVGLRALGDLTELTLIHEGFPSPEARGQHEQGWAGCLGRLDQAVQLLP